MKEADIRPAALFDRYLQLSRQDAMGLAKDSAGFVDATCPACGGHGPNVLRKWDYDYRQCTACGSLYLGRRPTAAQLEHFYDTAESVRFWGTDFYKQTAEARREKMFRPRAEQVRALADQLTLPASARFIDIGAGYGIFLEELRALNRFAQVEGIEPAADLAAICRDKGFPIHQARLEDLADGACAADLVSAFEVLEHVLDPLTFLQGVRRILAPGGITVLTTLTADGFDIRSLWDHAKSVYPPHHINLLSVEGYRRLLARAGLELVEITTPGKLDVDIVVNALRDDPTLPVGGFVRHLALQADDQVREAFQTFLQTNLLSSHIRIVARRPHV